MTVRNQKENDVSAHANIHSETAYDYVGEYGQGPETKNAGESSHILVERSVGPREEQPQVQFAIMLPPSMATQDPWN